MADMRIVVAGAGGRMGRMLVRIVAETPGLVLTGALERPDSALIGRDAGELAGVERLGIALGTDIGPLAHGADAILDFSRPEATLAFAAAAAQAGIVHVIGTTGLSVADEASIEAGSRRAVIVKSGNLSLGVNLMARLVRRVAATLDDAFDIEIMEMHHNQKVDAPSGTALLLGRAAAAGRGVDLAAEQVTAREGHTGARRAGQIGFAVLRGGTVVGDHSVVFAGPGERLELVHRAEDRSLFARGAVKAALWARGKPPGLYSMADVLGLGSV